MAKKKRVMDTSFIFNPIFLFKKKWNYEYGIQLDHLQIGMNNY